MQGILKLPLFLRATALLFVFSDLAVVSLSVILTVLVRYAFGGQFHPSLYWQLWPALGLFLLAFAALGLYPGALLSPPEELKKTFWGTSLIFLALGSGTFLIQGGIFYSRSIFAVAWLLTVMLLPLSRALIRDRCGARPWWGYPAVVIGDAAVGGRLVRTLLRRRDLGLKPAVLVSEDARSDDPELAGVPVIGPARFREIAGRLACPYAVVAMPDGRRQDTADLVETLGRHFQKIILVPDLMARSSLWVSAVDFGGILGLELKQKLLDPGRLAMKRAMDLLLTLLAAVVVLPASLAIAVAIVLESPGPVLYRQRRIGFDGREIRVFKFRTMVPDAERVLEECLARNEALCREWRESRKLKDDPRITRTGRWLRKYSLDELPQLLNVLQGEMSLVGPRPIVADEVGRYGDLYTVYARVRPGLTGLWQISGRNDLTYEERVALDAYYIRNWSVWLDIYILTRTLPVVLRGEGAY